MGGACRTGGTISLSRRGEGRVRRVITVFAITLLMLAGLAGSAVQAHQTKAVGPEGQYLVIVGFEREPIYTEERNALNVIIRRAADREPVENLEQTLFAEIISPDGGSRRELPLRAVHGQPGYYASDVVLTEPGEYGLRIWGYIFDVQFDEAFHTHEVTPLSELRFP